MTAEQDKKWTDEGLYYYPSLRWNPFRNLSKEEQPVSGQLYTKEEVLEFIRKEEGLREPSDITDEIRDYEFILFDDWVNDDYLEKDSETFTTPGGETIVVHCKFGGDY
jgi:hypothetical protein